MPEEVDSYPQPTPFDDPKLAEGVADKLLGEFAYAKLSTHDLARAGVISQNSESAYIEWVRRELGLDISIVQPTWRHLLQKLETNKGLGTDPIQLIPPGLEKRLRTQKLASQMDEPTPGKPQQELLDNARDELRDLAKAIVAASKREDESTYPAELDRPSEVFYSWSEKEIVEFVPELRSLRSVEKDTLHFAIVLPLDYRKRGETTAPPIIGPGAADLLVILNPQEHARLVNQVLDSPALSAYFLAQRLGSAQYHLYHQAREHLRKTATSKREWKEQQVNQVNAPLKAHVFNLLHRALSRNERVYITEVYRDYHDVQVMQGEAEPRDDRVGLESGSRIFTITRGTGKELIFSWHDSRHELTTEETKQGQRRLMKYVEEPVSAIVALEDGSLTIKPTQEERKKREGQPKSYNSTPEDTLRIFFDGMMPLKVYQMQERTSQMLIEAEKEVRAIVTQTNTLTELFSLMRVPEREYVFSTETQPSIFVEAIPPSPQSRKASLS